MVVGMKTARKAGILQEARYRHTPGLCQIALNRGRYARDIIAQNMDTASDREIDQLLVIRWRAGDPECLDLLSLAGGSAGFGGTRND